ncbi:MAG TPA: HAMP domain-containing sensor histidine kinase [Candidatus Udaeobacter sp.]|jgi:signal transduction histidine kinase|nr:HAMP domain-containing sensor histidine kinase [Candidatus Udaeobacter sp.]
MRLDLRTRILVFTALPIATLALATLWTVNHRVSRQVQQGIREDLVRASAVVENVLEARGGALELAGQVIVQDPKFFSTLTIPGSSRDAQLRATVAGVARDFNSLTRADLFEVTNARGELIASVGNESSDESARRNLVNGALSGRAESGMLVEPAMQWQVHALPVYAGGRVVGVLLLGSRIDATLAADLKRLTRSEVTFVSDGTMTGSTLDAEEDRTAVLQATLSAVRNVRSGGILLEVRTGGHVYLTLVRPLVKTGARGTQAYLMQRSLDVETAFLRETQSGLLGLGMIALVAALLTGGLIAQRITSPLQRLLRGAEEMERGNYDYPLEVSSRDEIGFLADRFDDMRQKQREYVGSLEEIARVKSEFLTVASHELRTPISVIRGYRDLMSDGTLGPVSHEQHEALHAMQRSVQDLTRIAEDATRMAQIAGQHMVLSRADRELGTLIENAISEARADGPGRQVAIHSQIERDLGHALVDGPRLGQAIANLVRNGIRFTPDGGRVDVAAARDAAGLVITVTDTGVGIPPEKQRHVFERASLLRDSLHHHSSSTLEFNSAGMGLGLSIAHGIVTAHGGALTVESAPGVGSRFTLRIPIVELTELDQAA